MKNHEKERIFFTTDEIIDEMRKEDESGNLNIGFIDVDATVQGMFRRHGIKYNIFNASDGARCYSFSLDKIKRKAFDNIYTELMKYKMV